MSNNVFAADPNDSPANYPGWSVQSAANGSNQNSVAAPGNNAGMWSAR